MEVSYKDPYEKGHIVVCLEDDTPEEALREILDFLEENTRQIQNAERRERYHTPYSLDALTYEGMEYALMDDALAALIRAEEELFVEELLCQLSKTQRRRMELFIDGMSIRQIAKLEGANYKSVHESIQRARKKMIARLCTPIKISDFSPYSEEPSSERSST